MQSNPLVAKLSAGVPLSADDRCALEAVCANRRAVGSRKDLVREGDRPEHIHIVLEGWAARYQALPDGSRQITAYLLPGDLCDMGVGVLARTDHSVRTLTAATIATVTPAALVEAARDRPNVVQALRWAAFVDEAVLRTWTVNLGRRDARARIAHLLCELYARLLRVDMTRDSSFDLPLTQEELADALGLTPVHVNRTIQRLRAEGLIKLHNHQLTITDIDRLRVAARFDPGYLHM